MNEKELQEKMLIYRTLESRLEMFTRQRELINNKLVEIVSTISSIDELGKKQENILFKIGSEAYAYGDISDKNEILVDVGAGIILEKSIEEGKETLNKRKHDMENAFKEVQTNIAQISNAMGQLGPEINELIEKSQNPTG